MIFAVDVFWLLLGEVVLLAGLWLVLHGWVYFPLRPMRLHWPVLGLLAVLGMLFLPGGLLMVSWALRHPYAVIESKKAFGAHAWAFLPAWVGFVLFGLTGWIQIGLRLYCRLRYGAPEPKDLQPPPPLSEEEQQAVLDLLNDPALLQNGPEAMADAVIDAELRLRGTPGWEHSRRLMDLGFALIRREIAYEDGGHKFLARFHERYLRQAPLRDPDFV